MIPMKKRTVKEERGSIVYVQQKWISHAVKVESVCLKFHCELFCSEWAVKLTEMADGKHHIGDFIPPEELEKFMKTYSVKENKQLTERDLTRFSLLRH